MELALDHVVVAVPDLDQAAEALERTSGLHAVPGGHHPKLGTKNALVPLGTAYIELLSVAEQETARGNAFGNAVLLARPKGPVFLGWVARTEAIEEAGAVWGSQPVPLSRRTPSGHEVRWRMAGLDDAFSDPARPLLIKWDEDESAPPFAPPIHPVGTVALDSVEIGDPARSLGAWLPPIPHVVLTSRAPAGVHSVTVTVEGRTIVVTEANFRV